MIERFAPGAGGVENVAWHVAHELARLGLDVTIITRAGEAPRAGSRTPRLAAVRVPTGWQPLRVLAFSRAAAAVAREGAFDVVHSFSRTRHQDLYRAGGGSHADYLDRMHEGLGRAARRLSPRHLVLLGIERAIFRDPSQRIQCSSRLVAEALVERHRVAPERILLLPNAVDAARFDSADARAAGARLRRQLDEKARPIWLLPGSGWRRKGLDVLLRAIAQQRDPELRLWLVGRDDPAPWQRRAAALGVADRLRFLGERRDMEAVYAAVDGMVLPSRYDAFANVTLEAAAAGLPVVTTTANGASEWLEGAVVRLEDAGDADALASAIASLAGSERRRALGTRAQRQARRFDWASHATALCREYERIVVDRRDRGPA